MDEVELEAVYYVAATASFHQGIDHCPDLLKRYGLTTPQQQEEE